LAAGKTDYCFVLLEAGKLKVKINLGAGESEISSPRGLRLDDLNWHLVNISRREGDLNLVVDKIHVVRYINYNDYLLFDLKLILKIYYIF
jgi:chondroitin sulfate proteoglycan 4